MSEIQFFCSSCGKQLTCDDANVGGWAKCPACKTDVVVPEIEGESSSSSARVSVRSRARRDRRTKAYLLALFAPTALACVVIPFGVKGEAIWGVINLLSIPAALYCGFVTAFRSGNDNAFWKSFAGLVLSCFFFLGCLVANMPGCAVLGTLFQ